MDENFRITVFFSDDGTARGDFRSIQCHGVLNVHQSGGSGVNNGK
jgi:hypothetical protein